MKFYTFTRESNDFSDILKDPSVKKHIGTKLKWMNTLSIGFHSDTPESVFGYIVLKFGDDIINPIERDYTPIPSKDYIPIRNVRT